MDSVPNKRDRRWMFEPGVLEGVDPLALKWLAVHHKVKDCQSMSRAVSILK
jgi:hypothetical protein